MCCVAVAVGSLLGPPPRRTVGAPPAQAGNGLVINEMLSQGISPIKDEDNSDQDWIELYNGTASPINLNQYGLTDVITDPFKWRFPGVVINPNSYLLVWASGKNRVAPQLHTNFKIDKDGEDIVLTKPDGSAVDALPPTLIPLNASYGRIPDGGSTFVIFSVTTPGTTNANGSTVVVDPPVFSVPGGFYTTAQQVALSSSTPGSVIRYTLDGSEPTVTSTVFSAGTPITISDRANAPNVFSAIRTTGPLTGTNGLVPWYPPADGVYKGTVLRTRAYSGTVPSALSAASYFISPDALTRYAGLPVVSITADPADLFNDQRGLFVLGPNAETTLPYGGANFFQTWEKSATIEFFEASRTLTFKQNVGLRLHGDVSRAQPMKSLRLYSSVPGNGFGYALFDTKPITQFQRLVLRNASQDFASTFIRDEVIQSGATANVLTQAYRPAVVFINGEYWGVHNLRERIDENFLANNVGVDPRNVDLLEFRFTETDIGAGDTVEWDTLLSFINTNSFANSANYAALQQRIDLANLTDYVLLNVWAVNRDWPGNNVRVWRERAPGAKWRWISFGSESGFGLPGWGDAALDNFEFLGFVDNDDSQLPLIMRKLLENPDYKKYLATRAADLLNAQLSSNAVLTRLNRFATGIDPLISEHIQRWRHPQSKAQWLANVEVLRENARARPDYMRDQMRARFGLGAPVSATIAISPANAGALTVNTWVAGPIGSTPWQGLYFAGLSLTATVQALPGYRFVRWQTTAPGATFSGAQVSLTPTAPVALTAMFEIDPAQPPPKRLWLPLSARN